MGISHCYINGEILLTAEGCIPINDLGFQRGYSVFDFARTANGKLFHFEKHLARFRNSAKELHIELPLSDSEFTSIAYELIELSDLEAACIRLQVTGGCSLGFPFSTPSITMIAQELPTYPFEYYSEGVEIVTTEYQREFPILKTINYINAIRLEKHRLEKQIFDFLFCTKDEVTELSRSNFFGFIGNQLITPAKNILCGVTREIVLDIAKRDFDVLERSISLEELGTLSEAFATSTSIGILPIVRINNSTIAKGEIGERTRFLSDLLTKYISNY